MRRAPRDRGIALDAECVAAVDRTARLLARARPLASRRRIPDALDDAGAIVHFVTIVAANVARALDAWGEKLGDAGRARRRRAAHLGGRRARPRAERRRAARQPRVRARLRPPHGGLVAGRLRPAADADCRPRRRRRSASSPRPPDEPFRAFIRAAAVRRLHVAVQPLRPAGDLTAAAHERRRPAGRRPARRRLRPRGPAAAGRRAARAGRAVEGSPAAGTRVRRHWQCP